MNKSEDKNWLKNYALLLTIGGIIGLFASAMLTIEKIHLLENPGAALGCDISPIVACGPVINTTQASVFGFPNPLLGIVGFCVVTTIGMMALAGATFKRWFWLGLQVGSTLGVIFVHWLIFQTMYRIGALCPYCMVVWSVTIPIFLFTTVHNLRNGHLRSKGVREKVSKFVQKYPSEILAVWFLVIMGLILERFWYYWSSLI